MAENTTLWKWGNQQKYHTEIKEELDKKLEETDLANVALSGSYNDLTDIPKTTEVMNTSDTGNIITITDAAADTSLISLTAYGRSWQGYASHGGEPLGKNLLANTFTPQTINGVIFTVNDDKTITINGTATDNILLNVGTILLKANTEYVLSGCPSENESPVCYVELYDTNDILLYTETSNGININFDIDTICIYKIRISNGTILDNIVIKPMIRLASITDDTYEPYYSNPNPDCPVPIESIGDSGSITVLSRDNIGTSITDIGIEGYGIPVPNNGNYTDSNGQQWVCDELIINTDGSGKFVTRTAIETFDGSDDERWGLSGSNKRINSNKLSQLAKPSVSSSVVMPCLCDKLTAKSGTETYSGTEGIAFDVSANVCIAFSVLADNSDISAWKSYLMENPITVVYQLANPTETELSLEQVETIKTLIKDSGKLVAYYVSIQGNNPSPENPLEIASTVIFYKSTTATISTTTPIYAIPVSDGGNYSDSSGQQWVCNELIVNSDGSGKIVKYTDIITFDGSSDERWGLSGSNKRINSDKLSGVAKPSESSSVVMPCLCDRLIVRSGADTYNGTEGIAFDASANVCISFSELADNSDISVWKNYLAANPVTVLYQRQAPEEIELSTDAVKDFLYLKTFNGITTITNNENGYMTVKYWCDKNMADIITSILPITGGEMQGALVAQSNTDYTTPQVRNVSMSTEAATGGNNGQIHFQSV